MTVGAKLRSIDDIGVAIHATIGVGVINRLQHLDATTARYAMDKVTVIATTQSLSMVGTGTIRYVSSKQGDRT